MIKPKLRHKADGTWFYFWLNWFVDGYLRDVWVGPFASAELAYKEAVR